MNIILVSGKLAKARSISLALPHLVFLGLGAVVTVITLAGLMHYIALRLAPQLNLPHLQPLPFYTEHDRQEGARSYLQNHLNAMAVQLGQMQAQLLRLDTLGDRLAKVAGFRPQDLMFDQIPGRGGALSTLPSEDLSLAGFARQIDLLTRQVDERGDRLGILESLFTFDSARKKLIPTMMPVDGGGYSSNYGWRIDPFTGQQSFHAGVDFMAAQGTPVKAAAGGVIVYSEYHPQYGNLIEIDHGNDLITRYAHNSTRLVRSGDVVQRGAKIGEVGSTGRATGPHLHFEVLHKGVAENPTRFLRAADQ